MRELFDSYFNLIWIERSWSWALVSILYFVLLMTVRSWFLKPLVQRTKLLDKKYCQMIKTGYLKNAFWGWLFVFVSIAAVAFAWYRRPEWEGTAEQILLLSVALFSFILSLICHLTAFGVASLDAMKKLSNEQLLA